MLAETFKIFSTAAAAMPARATTSSVDGGAKRDWRKSDSTAARFAASGTIRGDARARPAAREPRPNDLCPRADRQFFEDRLVDSASLPQLVESESRAFWRLAMELGDGRKIRSVASAAVSRWMKGRASRPRSALRPSSPRGWPQRDPVESSAAGEIDGSGSQRFGLADAILDKAAVVADGAARCSRSACKSGRLRFRRPGMPSRIVPPPMVRTGESERRM